MASPNAKNRQTGLKGDVLDLFFLAQEIQRFVWG
jgi:hypothetical protein